MELPSKDSIEKPQSPCLIKSFLILQNSCDACHSFLNLYTRNRKLRKARGILNESEQDLLRAMLLFASSGLDSLFKQTITDTLPDIIKKHDGARMMLTSYIEKRLIKNENIDVKFLVNTLVNDIPIDVFIKDLIYNLTSNSLQSKDELLRVAAYFDIPSSKIMQYPEKFKEIFHVRNQIAHEMDSDFSKPLRTRRIRKKDKMVDYAAQLLNIGIVVLGEIDKKLSNYDDEIEC